MAYAGQVITHPTMGISLKFIKTHSETNGIGWEAEYVAEPGKGRKAIPHTHLHSDEWFQVLQGECKFWLNGKRYKARKGSTIYFPANAPHIHPWNTGKETLVMRNLVQVKDTAVSDSSDIKKIEEYFEHWFHLACRGKVRKDGTPYLLQSAVFMQAIRKHIVMAKLPTLLQDIFVPPLAFAGKLKGYRRTYYE